jgi:hypothetical protein
MAFVPFMFAFGGRMKAAEHWHAAGKFSAIRRTQKAFDQTIGAESTGFSDCLVPHVLELCTSRGPSL